MSKKIKKRKTKCHNIIIWWLDFPSDHRSYKKEEEEKNHSNQRIAKEQQYYQKINKYHAYYGGAQAEVTKLNKKRARNQRAK